MRKKLADELTKLIRLLSQAPPAVHIKVDDTARFALPTGDHGTVTTESNAEIGAKHEFGIGVPQRSFLRMPLENKLPEFVEKTVKEPEELIKDSLKNSTLAPLMMALATACEATIQGAFETGGFGNWPAHSPTTKSISGKLLDETGQLRKAIKTEVK